MNVQTIWIEKIKKVVNGSRILVKLVDIIKITPDVKLGDVYGGKTNI